jgi:hypothetical protein
MQKVAMRDHVYATISYYVLDDAYPAAFSAGSHSGIQGVTVESKNNGIVACTGLL